MPLQRHSSREVAERRPLGLRPLLVMRAGKRRLLPLARGRPGRIRQVDEIATFEELIENAPGNFYMRSRFLLRRLQEGCPLLLSKSDPGQPREAAEDPGPARHQFGFGLWTWSISSTSTWPLPACSLSPSCSCKAANIVGACTFVPGIGVSGPASAVGGDLGLEAASSGEKSS